MVSNYLLSIAAEDNQAILIQTRPYAKSDESNQLLKDQMFIDFNDGAKVLAYLESEHFLIFSTDEGQVLLFNSELSHFQTVQLPRGVLMRKMFFVNEGKKIIAFPSTGTIVSFDFDERAGIDNGSMQSQKTNVSITPRISQLVDLSDFGIKPLQDENVRINRDRSERVLVFQQDAHLFLAYYQSKDGKLNLTGLCSALPDDLQRVAGFQISQFEPLNVSKDVEESVLSFICTVNFPSAKNDSLRTVKYVKVSIEKQHFKKQSVSLDQIIVAPDNFMAQNRDEAGNVIDYQPLTKYLPYMRDP